MESDHEAAIQAKKNAEKRFVTKDFVGAKNYALKAQLLFPELDGISQMVATFNVYVASEAKINGEIDFYSVIGLKPSADRSVVKKQYKKLAALLHPDKNKTIGADGAFKLVSEAWTLLSDSVKRASYDLKRNSRLSSAAVIGPTFSNNCRESSMPPTFWTVCTSCQVQYEYLRKYVNKRLSCKNCHATFMAVELETAPLNGSYPVGPWSYMPDNGYGGHGLNGFSVFPTNSIFVPGNGVPGYHSSHGSEYTTNLLLKWNTYPGTSAGYMDPNGLMAASADTVYHDNGCLCKPGKKIKKFKTVVDNVKDNGSAGYAEPSGTKATRPYKRRKVEFAAVSVRDNEAVSNAVLEAPISNGHGSNGTSPGFYSPIAPAFDARSLLIEKARAEIRKKLEEMKLASVAGDKTGGGRRGNPGTSHSQPARSRPVMLTVPDSDFHDFDNDRSEECFKPKQIWALYDEEDGMPRLYCLIHEVISVKPFKVHISYLSSKIDAEFQSVSHNESWFTKSCGSFTACNSEIVEQVNMFSHLLSREKAGKGGCVRIYPKSGDVWAVYRNCSHDRTRSTADKARNRYKIVEVLDDYSEELGVCLIPLTKVEGFKTVYRRNTNNVTMRWVPKREMARFSHRVPSWPLKGVGSLPEGCWDLDPAAIPAELLQATNAEKVEDNKHHKKDTREVV
ncbi:hypothetical protein Nepgr_008981 [Nepenthes gracilis]|uniref:J domain-containing protein n=1 Tax=Nepenthes gracilis TaxID=150966 RepID=A0AAD3XK03_NEPGR|nr:hypothetical protein Nepgr_008981 [Nepenthes gracilis]